MAAPALTDVTAGRNNNFNLIRFIAASLVIMFHEYYIIPTAHSVEPIEWLTRGRDGGGTIAVLIFFLISGFLIAQSFMSARSNLLSYFSARILRIFPALWVAIPFTIIVSSFASPIPWGRYLTHPRTLRYWLNNSFLWNMQFDLPGAFLHVPLARNVNGSLWTLPTEFRMYVICAVLGLLGLYSRRWIFNAFLLGLLITACFTRIYEFYPVGSIQQAQWELAFLTGTALYVNRNYIRLSIPFAILALLSTWFFKDPEMGRFYEIPALAYATFCFALHPALFFRPFTRIGDYSYGLYIYAFPLQQQIRFYHPSLHWIQGLFITYPIILGVAIVSWHLIEKPALRLKSYFQSRPSARREEAVAIAMQVGFARRL